MSHNKSYNWSRSLILGPESKSRFLQPELGVWSPKFSNTGVGVPQKNDSAFLTATVEKFPWPCNIVKHGLCYRSQSVSTHDSRLS